jgi:hypothetical protein
MRERKSGVAVKKEPTDDMDESVSEALRLPMNTVGGGRARRCVLRACLTRSLTCVRRTHTQGDAKEEDDGIVFTTTTEFCRGLDTTQSIVETRKREKAVRVRRPRYASGPLRLTAARRGAG